MPFFNRLTAVVLAAALTGPLAPIQARTRQGDKDLAQGRTSEAKKDWDDALDSYRKALATDPADIQYQMSTQKARFEASQKHVENGQKIRAQGSLGEALLEFQHAFAIDPSSAVAVQEIQTTQGMIDRERQRVLETGKASSAAERAMTPLEQTQQETQDRLDRMLPVPELRPLGPSRFDFQINSNIPKTLFETLGAFAGVNVLWDSDIQPPPTSPIKNGAVKFQNSTLDEALDYLSLLTTYYWKPLSSNTIFVTADTRAKRTQYQDQVAKVFYISNVQLQQDLQEIVNAVRTVADVQRMSAVVSQNAIVARGDADQMALVEKVIHDLDRPKAEVVVDVIVMTSTTNYSRQLAAALMPTGLNMSGNFTPTNGLQVTTPASGTTAASTTTGTSIPLSSLGHLASADWSTTLPSGLLQAVMSSGDTQVLQAPQVREIDNGKATLNIGDKEPTASGSFGSAVGLSGAGVSPLVNTQFQYLDIGVNVSITPRVHENGDISMHVELDISSVDGQVNLGGINEPIIAQKKVTNDIRLHEGEISLLGGLINVEDDTTKTGVPGLANIPLLGRLFRSDTLTHNRNELMIALVPHVVRRPEFSAENLRAVDVGTANAIHLSYAPPAGVGSPAPAGQAAPSAGAVLAPPSGPTGPAAGTTPAPVTPPAPNPEPVAPAPTTVPAAPPPAAAPSPALAPTAPGAPPGLPFPLQQLMHMPGAAGAPGAPAPPPGTASAAPPGAAPTAANAPDAARFEPAQFETSTNGTFSAALVLDSGADVVSAQPLQIQYDPKLLRLTDVSAGDFFSRDGVTPAFSKDIQDDQGIANVEIGRPAGATGVNAPGTLLTLKFQALAPGATTVSVLNVTPRNSHARAVSSSHPQMAVTIK